jgi:serine/threonine protein kinase
MRVAGHAAADRNLLFGIVALQMEFISREALVAAMNAWVLDKSKPLGEILVEQKALTSPRHELLESLVEEHLRQHGNDPQLSLAALASPKTVKDQLTLLCDRDVQASIAIVPAENHDGEGKELLHREDAMSRIMAAASRFKILRPWREGGLGKVSIARDEELQREVALKEIKPQHAANQVSRERFIQEAEITGSLEHPGIVPVYGLGKNDDGKPYYAMRFIRGESLDEAIERFHQPSNGDSNEEQEEEEEFQKRAPTERGNPAVTVAFTNDSLKDLNFNGVSNEERTRTDKQQRAKDSLSERTVEFRELLNRFITVCNAVAYAHSRGILHRDLKPANVILGKYGETLVVDWGLAKVLGQNNALDSIFDESLLQLGGGSSHTRMGSVIGTPAYMSPEQAAGQVEQLTPASDIYSLGATLYCLLTGRSPFDGKNVQTLLDHVQKGKFPRPRQINKEIAPALEAICLKAMALDPEDRYAKPTALADDLEHWLADEPVTAYAEPLIGRVRRWGRRHRAIATGAAALLATSAVALAVGLAVLSGKQAEIVRERNNAVAARNDADRASQQAQHAAAQADARYFIQSDEETPALERATEAYKLGGTFEDGLLVSDCVKGSRGRWALAAEIKTPGGVAPLCATFASADGKDVLVAASENRIDEHDVHTGQLLATTPMRGKTIRLVAPRIPAEGLIVAQSRNGVTSFRLPKLEQITERKFEAEISEVSAAEKQLAILERNGRLTIVDFASLQDVASKDFAKNFPDGEVPVHCAIAPDGSMVAAPGRNWWKPGVVWNANTGEVAPANLKTSRPLAFIDNQTVVSWYSSSTTGESDDGLLFTDTSRFPPVYRSYAISGIDTKDVLDIQAWTEGKSRSVGLRGRIGSLWWRAGGYETDRYANLWPFSQEHVEGLCAAYPRERLALVQGSKILVFEHRSDAGDLPQSNFSVAAAHSGAVVVQEDLAITYCPYDLRQRWQRTQLVSPYGEKWHPWAVAVSADDSTLVLLIQQSDNYMVGGDFGPTRALVFRPGSWLNAEKPEAWKVQAAFELDMPSPESPWDPRTLAISADGSVLAYASRGGVVRYSVAGEKLDRSPDWETVCRSSDGTLMAGISTDGRIKWLDVASGKTEEIRPSLRPIRMCFVRDNSGIVVGDGKSLTRYDLKTGNVEWTKPCELLPLAWPAKGDRFVALQEDATDKIPSATSKTERTLSSGSLVLAKTASGEIVSILAKYGSDVSIADFSTSEREVLLRGGRWQSKILRNLNPEEAVAYLRTLAATGAIVTAPASSPEQVAIHQAPQSAAIVLDAGGQNLTQHFQETVTIVGHVQQVSWTSGRDGLNIELEGPESLGVLIWVAPTEMRKLVDALGPDFEQKLHRAKLQIRGRLLKYGGLKPEWKGRLQITFDSKDNIKIVSDGGTSSSSVPSAGSLPPEGKSAADASAKPAAAGQAAPTLDASGEQLTQHVGENVVVVGRVQVVSWTIAHTGVNIEFEGPEESRLMVWVSPKSLDMLKAALGDDFETKLNGARLEVRGKLRKYAGVDPNWKERFQITFDNKDQIKILSSE